jgi:hypothetical protein
MYFCHRGDTVSKNGRGTMLLPPAGFFVHTDTNCYGGGTGCVSESEDAFTECYSSTASGRGWMNIQGATGPGKPLAGGHLWVLVDYNSDCNVGTHPMGILDQYRIPKKAYYSYQTNWTTTPSDYPTKGLTATSLRLEADVTNLVADSTDLSRIIASVRDASGKCVWSSADITFQVTGPADVFDTISVPRRAIAGKIAIILKSKNTSGTITITASAPGLMPATLTLASAPADNSSLPFIWPSSGITHSYADRITDKNISVRQTAQSIQVAFPSMDAAKSIVTLVNLQGKIIACPVQRKGFFVEVSTQSISRGFYFLRVTSNDEVVLKRVIVAK